MPSVTIRGVPHGLLQALRVAARARRRSLNAQLLAWLEEARAEERVRGPVDDLLRELDRHAARTRRRAQTDSARLIRRMRDAR